MLWTAIIILGVLGGSGVAIVLLHRLAWRATLSQGQAGIVSATGRIRQLDSAGPHTLEVETPIGHLRVDCKTAQIETYWLPHRGGDLRIGDRIRVRGLLRNDDGQPICDAAQIHRAGWPRVGWVAGCVIVCLAISAGALFVSLSRPTGCPPGTRPDVRRFPTAVERSCRTPDSTRHGPASVQNHVGRVITRGHYRRGLKTGRWQRFHRNGRLAEQTDYVSGQKTGLWQRFHQNGALAARAVMTKGSGEVTAFYEDGVVSHRGRFERGRREGRWRFFDRRGMRKTEGTFRAGKRHGSWLGYHPNQTLAWRTHYRMGKRHGVHDSFDENGNRDAEGRYKDSKKHGVWKWFHPGGKALSKTGTFKAGKKHGRWLFFDTTGKHQLEAWYDEGKRSGTWRYYCAYCEACDLCSPQQRQAGSVVEKRYPQPAAPQTSR